ncbi:hypothetical protein D1007_55683 [Hordeum vulgare]|nr:hypothetical protein D1007_55683 [Hordeum vulgare]
MSPLPTDTDLSNNVQRVHAAGSELVKVPASVEDPDYHGLELDIMVFCDKHDKASMRHVAFEGTNKGRRMHWAMFEDTKNARVTDNLESALPIHHPTEQKNNLDANYDKLVKDVHDLMDFQEERVIDFSYLQSNLSYQQQCRSEVVADMKGRMSKKDEDSKHLNDKYQLAVNLTRAQADVIQNLKLKNMKEKQVHSEAIEKLELKNAELTKSEEKLTQEKMELKFQIVDLLKGKEVHSEERGQLELSIAELKKEEEELKMKLKFILAILQK